MDAPWFNEYVYLLDSLASIKTVCLIPDLPHGDELTRKIFKEFFELVESVRHPSTLGSLSDCTF